MSYNYSSSRTSYTTDLKPKDKDQPLDTVSSIVWDLNSSQPTFLTSSWDGYVRMYIVRGNNIDVDKVWSIFLNHPVLCVDINESGIIFAGLASGDVVAIEISSGNVVQLGVHQAPICGLYWIREKSCLMTLGFDNLIRFWILDPNNALQKQFKLPLKTVACSFDFPSLLIGSVETTATIINIKNLPNINIPTNPDQYHKFLVERFSKFNCARINSSSNNGILGTIDGRAVAFGFRETYNGTVEYLDPFVSRLQKKLQKSVAMFGQVNCVEIGIHSYSPYLVIGGTDDLSVYNYAKKSKAKTICNANSTIGATTAVRLSPKSDYIAYATGSDWLKGLHELETLKKPKITVWKLTNSDLSEFISK